MSTIVEALNVKGKLIRCIQEALVDFSEETSLTITGVCINPVQRIGATPAYRVEVRCEL